MQACIVWIHSTIMAYNSYYVHISSCICIPIFLYQPHTFLRVIKGLMIHNNLLTQSRHILVGKFCTNIFLISIALNYFWVVKNCKILTFNVNFLHRKLSKSFSIFLLKNIVLGADFLLLTFFENFNLHSTLFSKMTSNFWQLWICPLAYALIDDHRELSQLWSP